VAELVQQHSREEEHGKAAHCQCGTAGEYQQQTLHLAVKLALHE
jgi:hypothetical protein